MTQKEKLVLYEGIRKALKERLGAIEKPNNPIKKPKRPQKSKDWIEVKPHGLVGGMIPDLCLLVFKEKDGSNRFALSISHIQAEISISRGQSNNDEPFRFVTYLLNRLKVYPTACYFMTDISQGVRVEMVFKGNPQLNSVCLNANDVIPFAIYSGCRFFCTPEFMLQMLDQKVEKTLQKEMIMKKPQFLN